MSECIDNTKGRLLHDFELGLLSEDDRHQFEMHLYECEYCLNQVREFMDVSKILIKDPDVIALIEKLAEESRTQKNKKKLSPLLKVLLAAILIVFIAVPVYHYSTHKVVQTLEFLSTRSGGSDIIYLEKGGSVTINFFVGEDFDSPANLIISKVDGDTVLFLQDYREFNEFGLGTISMKVSDFSEGHYKLKISPTSEKYIQNEKIYMFRVK